MTCFVIRPAPFPFFTHSAIASFVHQATTLRTNTANSFRYRFILLPYFFPPAKAPLSFLSSLIPLSLHSFIKQLSSAQKPQIHSAIASLFCRFFFLPLNVFVMAQKLSAIASSICANPQTLSGFKGIRRYSPYTKKTCLQGS